MRERKGFTLIELLVVMSIIAILAGLLVPGVLRAMRQAKSNRALSEMQHLATVISQVYSEVGYYVRLEDLAKSDAAATGTVEPNKVWIWKSYSNGQSDDEADSVYGDTALAYNPTVTMWNGPYTTYKTFVNILSGARPIDPWGKADGSDAEKAPSQYRMFWVTNPSWPATDSRGLVPAGASGAMVIISAGPDKIYQCGIGSSPAAARQANFQNFNPTANDKGDDVYYIFNAGVQ